MRKEGKNELIIGLGIITDLQDLPFSLSLKQLKVGAKLVFKTIKVVCNRELTRQDLLERAFGQKILSSTELFEFAFQILA